MNTTQTEVSEYLLKLKAALEDGKRDQKTEPQKKQHTPTQDDRKTKSGAIVIKKVLSTSDKQDVDKQDPIAKAASKTALAPEHKAAEKQKRIPFNKNERVMSAHTYLHETFPHVFKRENKLPLKIGILSDLFERLGDNAPSKKSIRDAVQFYTSNYHYQKALLANDKRYDLDGNEVGIVEDKQKEHATERHDKIAAIIQIKQQKRQAFFERKRMLAEKAERLNDKNKDGAPSSEPLSSEETSL